MHHLEQSMFVRKNVRYHQWGFGDIVAPYYAPLMHHLRTPYALT